MVCFRTASLWLATGLNESYEDTSMNFAYHRVLCYYLYIHLVFQSLNLQVFLAITQVQNTTTTYWTNNPAYKRNMVDFIFIPFDEESSWSKHQRRKRAKQGKVQDKTSYSTFSAPILHMSASACKPGPISFGSPWRIKPVCPSSCIPVT